MTDETSRAITSSASAGGDNAPRTSRPSVNTAPPGAREESRASTYWGIAHSVITPADLSVVHCWADGPHDDKNDCGTTCMLLDGHDGPHRFTRDDMIEVEFHDGE
jgi:hypothetical protein